MCRPRLGGVGVLLALVVAVKSTDDASTKSPEIETTDVMSTESTIPDDLLTRTSITSGAPSTTTPMSTEVEGVTDDSSMINTNHFTFEESSTMSSKPGEGNCQANKTTYANGESIPVSSLCYDSCICKNSVVSCELKSCPAPPPWFLRCTPVEDPDQCCPTYKCQLQPTSKKESPDCLKDSIQYLEGEYIPSSDICKDCYCINGTILCAAQECVKPGPNCKPTEFRNDNCCPLKYECEHKRVIDISPPPINFECGVAYTTFEPRSSESIHGPYPLISTPRPQQQSPSQFGPDNTGFRRRRDLGFPPNCFSPVYHPPSFYGFYETTKYPWMALLGEVNASNRTWFCGGVLINRRWVLTAAHCTNRYNATIVRLRKHDFSKEDEGDHEDINVAEVVFHIGNKPKQAYHDISLIRMATPIKIRKEIGPVCLPWDQEADNPLESKIVTVSEWGSKLYDSGGKLRPFLREIDVTLFPTADCAIGYLKLRDSLNKDPQDLEMLCFGDYSNQTLVKDTCPGGSGGPAVFKIGEQYTLVGIVSQGVCKKWWERSQPGLYVAVQHPENLDWIKRVAFTTCDSMCVNGNCNSSNSCECLDGWSGQVCDIAICDPNCLRGQCISPNRCQCENWHWKGDQCQILTCRNGKSSPDSLSCTCDSGWGGEACDTPICDPSCVNGKCFQPNRCLCDCSWYGDRCQTPYCYNGNSFDNLTCTCDVGWTGTLCDIAICNPPCVNGDCVAPNQCDCHGWKQWRGDQCQCEFDRSGDQCQYPYCYNGNPFDNLTCTCDAGWTGAFCDIAICSPPCVNGNCVAPNECDCDRNNNGFTLWTGKQCQCDYGRHGDQCQHSLPCQNYTNHFSVGNQCFFAPAIWGRTWYRAQEMCKWHGGILAEPDDIPKFREALLGDTPYANDYRDGFWLGGSDMEQENVWKWSSDGAKVGNSENWSPGEPNNAGGHCLYLVKDREKPLSDLPCHKESTFICETT